MGGGGGGAGGIEASEGGGRVLDAEVLAEALSPSLNGGGGERRRVEMGEWGVAGEGGWTRGVGADGTEMVEGPAGVRKGSLVEDGRSDDGSLVEGGGADDGSLGEDVAGGGIGSSLGGVVRSMEAATAF